LLDPGMGVTSGLGPTGLVYDDRRGSLLAFAYGQTTAQPMNTFEWNGVQWSQVAIPGPPVGSVCWDGNRGAVVECPSVAQTWELWSMPPCVRGAVTSLGSGCPGPAGLPFLGAAPGSLPRIGSTLTLWLSNLDPQALPLLAFGLDTTSWGGLPLPASLTSIGAPGCSAYLAPILFQILPNQGGTAVSSIALPFAPGFIGTSLYAQGLLG